MYIPLERWQKVNSCRDAPLKFFYKPGLLALSINICYRQALIRYPMTIQSSLLAAFTYFLSAVSAANFEVTMYLTKWPKLKSRSQISSIALDIIEGNAYIPEEGTYGTVKIWDVSTFLLSMDLSRQGFSTIIKICGLWCNPMIQSAS